MMMPDIFSRYEFLIYLLGAMLIASVYLSIRKIKLERLIKKNRITDAKKFRFGVETSIAVSGDGLICAINSKLETLTIHIKDIAEFEILLSTYCITNAKASKNDGILFSGIGSRLKPILEEEKLKGIVFIVKLKNNKIFGINLFKGMRVKKLLEVKQNNIVQLFNTLEAVERKCKGKQLS